MSTILDPRDFRTLLAIFAPREENITNAQYKNRRTMIGYFYLVLALIAFVYLVVMSHLTRHYDNKKHRSGGRNWFLNNFGLPVPVTHVVYRYHPMACAAAYLCAFSLTAGLFTNIYAMKHDFPNAPAWLDMVFKISAVCFMALCLIPIFLSINYGGIFAWIFGAIYCFVNFAFILAATLTGFRGTVIRGARHLSLQLPALIGYTILCGHFICNLGRRARQRKPGFFKPCPPDPISYVNSLVTYVKERLQPVHHSGNVTITPKIKCHSLFRQTFRPPPGFYYPTALIWCLVTSVWLHYFMLNRVLTKTYMSMTSGKKYITAHYPEVNKSLLQNLAISNARHVFQAFDMGNTSQEERFRIEYTLLYYFADLFWVGTVSASAIACLVNLMTVIKILYNYQMWSFKLYQKGFRHYPQFEALLNPVKVTTGTVLFPSYQIAMMGCGFHLQVLLYLFLFMLLSIVIGLNAFTTHTFLVDFFRTMWPTFILMTMFNIFQDLLIRFVYTSDRGRTNGFDNVRSFQEFMYFTSFYNVFFGIINGVMRILFCPICSAVSVARMDMSLFPEALYSLDKAYISFLGYLYGDVMQNHPVLRTFIWLLSCERFKYGQLIHSYDLTFLSECLCYGVMSKGSTGEHHGPLSDPESRTDKRTLSELDKIMLMIDSHNGLKHNRDLSDQGRSLEKHSIGGSNRARNRWFVAYTLMKNPHLKRYRKSKCENPIDKEPKEDV